MRLIDADEFMEIINYTFSKPPFSRKTIKHMIDMARTVDAVPIIRCNDCRYWGQDGYREGCKYAVTIMTEDDYCSMAERKEE